MKNVVVWAHGECVMLRILAKGLDHSLVQSLDAILLLLAYTWLRFDNHSKLKDIILNFVDVHVAGDSVTAGHLLDVCLQFAYQTISPFDVTSVWGAVGNITRICFFFLKCSR